MLKLTIKHGEWLVIGDARIKLTKTNGVRSSIVIDAPKSVKILRSDAIKRNAA